MAVVNGCALLDGLYLLDIIGSFYDASYLAFVMMI